MRKLILLILLTFLVNNCTQELEDSFKYRLFSEKEYICRETIQLLQQTDTYTGKPVSPEKRDINSWMAP